MRSKRLEIRRIRGQDGPAGLGHRHDQGIHGGTAASTMAEQGGAARQSLRNALNDIAGLEQLILGGVTPCMALETFHQHDGRNPRRPQPFIPQGEDQSQGCARPLGQTSNGTGVQDQQRQPALRVVRLAIR